MVAVMPTAAALIASRMPDSVLLVASMVTLLVAAPADVKVAGGGDLPVTESNTPPLKVPKSNVSVPLPMAVAMFAVPGATSFWPWASLVTAIEYEPGAAVLPALADSTLESEAVAVRAGKRQATASPLIVVCNPETAPLRVPNAESFAWYFASCLASRRTG